MKKRKVIIGCLLISGLVAGCSCKKENIDTFANVSNDNSSISTGRGESLTVGEMYSYILENQKDQVAQNVVLPMLEKQINLSDTDMLTLYKRYLNEYFTKTFVENDSYKVNGKFNENLLVEYLRSESYDIACGTGINSGMLDNSKFSCDYSDYIKKEVNYDIYMKMLKVKYILSEKSNLIDKNDARRVTYYMIEKGSNDNEVREKLEQYVTSMEENYASTDETLVKNINDIAEIKRKEDLAEIKKQYDYISTSQDSSSGYTYLNKFTTCGDMRCSIEDGKEYQDNLIMKKDYVVTSVVIKDNTEILYESARGLLFSDNVEDYLYKIGSGNNEAYYLMAPAYISSGDQRINDIIHFDSSTNKYYLAIIEVIDSNSSFADKVAVAELLINKVSDSTIYDYCFEKLDVKIYDKAIKEYFETKYGKIDKE